MKRITLLLAIAALGGFGCAHQPPPAPTRTYLALPAVDDMEGVVRWLELQRTVAVQVDGLDPDSEEVRALDARILAATEAWAGIERSVLADRRKYLTEVQGLGDQHQSIVELDRSIAELDARLATARARSEARP